MNNLACVWFLSAIVAKAANVDIKAHVGTTVDLPCRVDTSLCGDLHSVKFYRETSRIYVYSHVGGISRAEGDATNRMKVEYTPTSTEALLKITPVEIQDEASYKCEITYLEVRENCDVVQIIKLTTLVKPESVRMLTANGVPMSNSSVLGPLHEGTSVEMICEAHGGRPTPLVKWFNGTQEVKATYTPVDDGDGVGSGIAKLQMSLTRGDLMARYECRVESDALDEPIVSWVTTDVNVKPTNIHLSGVKNHVVQGTNVLLTCDVSGAKPAAEVKWFNNSIAITDDRYIYSSAEEMPDGTFTTKSRLVFEATRWENGNAFHCYADNTVIREQKDSSLHSVLLIEVYYPPVVSVSPSNITTNESGNILLLCTYISNPMKLEGVVWAKDGKNLTLTDDKYEGGHIDNPPLRIKNVTREDMGEYRCICQNSVPSQESHDSVFLNVQFAPIVVVNMDPSTPVKSKDKINVTLECAVASGNPSNLLKVRWFLGNELLKELPECNYTSFDENGNGEGDGGPLCDIDPSILSLEAVEETFAGNYTCQGKNIAGWGTESEPHELIVYYAPSPAKLRYSPAKVVKKSSVTLECSVDNPGRPDRIRYLWYKGVHLVPDVTTPNWTISPVTIGARSNFTCIATNEGGNSENASIFIDVSAPPAFILNLHPYQGFLMSSKNISLTCRVECSPLCSIVWFKDGQQLNFETNHLYHVKTAIYPPDLRTNDFESIESTLIWNMTAWPGEQLDRTAPNSNYICQSSHNAIGPGVNSSIEIAVDYPPENLTVSNRVVSVVENHLPEKVYCNGKGHPKLSYTWKKDDSPDFLSKTNIMTLGAVTRADSGKYVCEAINRHGAETTNVYLNVQYAPECNLETVDYAGSPALECTAHANPQEVTFLYKIKGDNDTVDASGMVQKGLKSYLPLDLGVDTFRTYQCFVNNSVGTSSPCERDVAAYQEQSSQIGIPGTVPWWKQFANENLIILVAVVVGVVICIIIICVIIVLVCRRKRASNKYNSPVEMEEREKFRSASLPKGGHRFRYDKKRNKLCARLARLKEMLGIRDQDSLPLGVYRGSTGVTFKKFKASTPNLARRDNQNLPSRKRKKPGYPPNQSSMADKGGSGAAPPSGGLADPLIDPDKGFYENLPFHGMQNAPNKPISIITPTVHTNSRPHASPSSAQLMPRPLNVSLQQQSVVRARIQRNQSFHGFQNNQNQLLVDGTTPDWMQFSNPNLMQPIFGQVPQIRTNPNFFTTNCNRINSFGNRGQLFGAANPFSGPARVVGRNENKLDIRRTASGINIAQKPTTDDSVGQSVKNSQDKTEVEPLKKQKKPKAFDGRAFGSLELRAHKCYSPTFYSMRCKKHAKRRPIIYAVLRRSKAPEKIKAPESKDDYQNLTDSIQILEQNAENDKAETRSVPKAAPRCRKHRKSEIIYANVSLAPKVANLDSSNESSVHEGEISVTEVLVHKESKDLKPDDANDPKNDANEKIETQTEQSPKPKIIDFSAKKSPGLLLKSTPTVKVSPNFIKPKVVSPKGALYMQLQARLKNSKQHASTQTAALIKDSPSKDSTTQTTQTKSSQSETSPSVPKMPLLDLEMHNKKKNELMCANQNAFYTLTTPHFKHAAKSPMPQQYSATIPHQKHIKLIPRSLFQEQQINKSKSFSSKTKSKKHFQIPLQKCQSFKFQTAESYFQPIKNIHEENLMRNGYVSDMGASYPESQSRARKREKHKQKLVVRRTNDYQENVQFQENVQNSVQLQYPQPAVTSCGVPLGRNGKPNGLVYADLDMPKGGGKKNYQDAASLLSKVQKAKTSTEYATLKFNDIGQEIDV